MRRCAVSGGGLRLYAPLCIAPGRYGLCGRNREKRAFYLSAAWAGAGRGVGPRAAIGRPYYEGGETLA